MHAFPEAIAREAVSSFCTRDRRLEFFGSGRGCSPAELQYLWRLLAEDWLLHGQIQAAQIGDEQTLFERHSENHVLLMPAERNQTRPAGQDFRLVPGGAWLDHRLAV
jgi:hypothetical protein